MNGQKQGQLSEQPPVLCQGIHLGSHLQGKIQSFKTKLHLALNPAASECCSYSRLPDSQHKNPVKQGLGLLEMCLLQVTGVCGFC